MSIGIEGFKWDEVQIGKTKKVGKRSDDAYIYMRDSEKATQFMVNKTYCDLAEWNVGTRLKLYSQGKNHIYMLQNDSNGPIEVKKTNGLFTKIGNVGLARILYGLTNSEKFEVMDAAEGYILFKPIKE